MFKTIFTPLVATICTVATAATPVLAQTPQTQPSQSSEANNETPASPAVQQQETQPAPPTVRITTLNTRGKNQRVFFEGAWQTPKKEFYLTQGTLRTNGKVKWDSTVKVGKKRSSYRLRKTSGNGVCVQIQASDAEGQVSNPALKCATVDNLNKTSVISSAGWISKDSSFLSTRKNASLKLKGNTSGYAFTFAKTKKIRESENHTGEKDTQNCFFAEEKPERLRGEENFRENPQER